MRSGDSVLAPRGEADMDLLRFEIERKVLFEQQMEIAYVSVLLNSLLNRNREF